MALAQRLFPQGLTCKVSPLGLRPLSRPCSRLVARADGPKVTREYREDSDTISTPGAAPKSSQSEGLYVDDAIRPPQKASNLSKEMRAKLKQEYVGLGGAENKVAIPHGRLVVAAATIYEERAEQATVVSEASTSSASASTTPKQGQSKWVIDENENLKSTNEHRAWTYGAMALMAATLAQAAHQIQTPTDAAIALGMMFSAYVLADLGTGVYHWGVDNYGDAKTPAFGRQIAAFQGHHQRPWTITQREFCNNLHQVFKPAAYPAAAILAISPFMPMAWNAWASSFLFLICMSQQFHAWSHMKKSELPAVVVALQDANVLISRKAHGAHHRAPFEGNYCIVSGWWNDLLDSTEFFRKFEKVLHTATGVEPRCWSDPLDDWAELQRPEVRA